ncbi:MAG TPA: beta-ketoacyl synthase N-terminal-like domain-containing protein [Desulfuromonadales bacterium]|nr:beta-ketoacyl synthase N-terminal-like domain-containing protein [Desulfuromonadales bacterium]
MKHGKSVAIVGVGGIFPQSPTLQRFWANICEKVNTARRPPQGRWLLSADAVYDPRVGAADRVYSDRACFVEQSLADLCLDDLDISADFLADLDPMFYLMLHAGRQAYLDGGAPAGERVGTILGNLCLPSEKSSALARAYLGATFAEQALGRDLDGGEASPDPVNRYVAGLPAGILAKSLGLQGTCFTLDAACASSLYALKLAVDELVAGRADAMLAGGLSRPDSLYTQMGFSQLRALSPTGTCSPFDEKGNGLVVGEGCGMFLLKRTEDAVRDKDRIYAVIRGIGLANDLGGSLLAPASEGQLRAMRAAYRQAGWAPGDVDLVECHATGTPVGDAVEFSSLQALWGEEEWQTGQCVIGSVKSNVGHLLTAAGSAALMKTLLALQEQTLPPTANYSSPARDIALSSSPFRVLDQPQPWQSRQPDVPRRAAISAFGFGGINAHLLIEEWQPPKPVKGSVTFPPSFQRPNQPVAIVGLGAEFGPWAGLEAFQYRVLGCPDKTAPRPPLSWWGAERCSWFEQAGLDQVAFRGHFIEQVASAPGRFRIPPRELEEMLPRQLLMLQVAEQALNDSGLHKEDLLFTGVFIGTGLDLNATNFALRWGLQKQIKVWAEQLGLDLTEQQMAEWLADLREAAGPPLTANRVMGALGSIVASRIAKEFRIGGPSFTISGEENSGLRALEVGLRALQEGSVNRALVGAVDLAGDLRAVLGRHALVPFSAKGCATPFDKQADGGIIGEGAAAVVLKRLEDAQQDGDRIYAVIRGIGSAVGGTGHQPDPERETYDLALERTFQNTGVRPGEVGYLEAEGCGRPEIDRLEANALGDFFGAERNDQPCYVGSAKADIGHAGAAAGLASLVKAALCLDRQVIPPLRNIEAPRYEWIRGKRDFLLPTEPRHWLRNRSDGPRKALVSSLAVDGSCCHALLEEYAHGKTRENAHQLTRQPLGPRREALFCLEADDAAGLLEKASRLEGFLAEAGDAQVETLAARWLQQVAPEPSRQLCVSLVAADRQGLLTQLRQAVASLEKNPERGFGTQGSAELLPGFRDRTFYAPRPLTPEGRIAFIFPGSGNHFAGMGRELSLQWPQIFRSQDGKNRNLAKQFLPQHFWKQTLADAVHGDHNALVIGQVALGTAVSDLVRSFGIEPHAVSGYSLGEAAGLFALRAWTDRDGMLQRLEDSSLFVKELAGDCRAAARAWKLPADQRVDWALGLVDVPAAAVQEALAGLPHVYLLIVNTYLECVVGGDRRQLDELVTRLGCHLLPLQGVTTVHCEVVEQVAEAYRRLHLFPTTPPAGIDFYCSAQGDRYQVTDESAAEAILQQALATVDYTQVIEKLYADGVRVFLEMGPGNSCSRMIGSILGERPHLARSACAPGGDAVSLLLRLLGQCLAERVPVDLCALYPAESTVVRQEHSGARIGTVIGGRDFRRVAPPVAENQQPTADDDEAPVAAAAMAGRSPAIPESPAPAAAPIADPAIAGFERLRQEGLAAHAAYLDFSSSLGQAITTNMALQMQLLERMLAAGERIPALADRQEREQASAEPAAPATLPTAAAAAPGPARQTTPPPAFDRSMCLEFAVGSIAKMLGPEFAAIDRHPTRVRLPDEPLMLVDRILTVEGEPRSLTGGRVVTEHDVTADRWYLDGGRIPTCIAVEAGQADLFLSAYLGIDFVTRGLAVYRLLDAVVTFHRSLPVPGDVIRYDIKIDHFFRQDQTYLFRFNFEATVNGEPLLSMQNGCAGFFSAQELAAGQGIVQTRLDLQPQTGTLADDWRELVPMRKEAYDETQVAALYRGDLAACFGEAFAALDLERPYTLPGGQLKLVDRVLELDPNGGRYGLGLIRAEMDIHPEDWFLTCHFCDDNVMPGTLMYECCMHTLRIFLLRLGWIGEQGQTWCEPVPGVDSGLKCRGQVIDTTRKVTYQVSIKELGYRPEPFAIVDALMYADGKPIVAIPDMSVRLAGLDRQQVEKLWAGEPAAETAASAARTDSRGSRPALYDYGKILAFSDGKPSEAFGEAYRIFDQERKIARLPRPPYQFLDRIVDVTGEAFQMTAGATCVAEYDVPPDAWYFAAERAATMPFAVLLEIGLQPCGWLAAYLGSALTSDTDLKFRNLDGNAVQHRAVTAGSGTLTTRVEMTSISRSGGMIIQAYAFEISDSQGPVYTGDTVFGFFSAESLAQQVGIRQAEQYRPSAAEAARGKCFDYPVEAPFPQAGLRMIDTIELLIADGGPEQLGFIRGSKRVDPAEWFFAAHFYQDPVCPGSLGLESMLQLLKVVAFERWGVSRESRFESIALDEGHLWNYRGQIVPGNEQVVVEAVVTAVDDAQRLLRADGYLAVDGRIIYRMKDFSLRLV